MTIAIDAAGREHAVLTDGRSHIRLDVETGTLMTVRPVVFHYRLSGLGSAETRISPLRRFLFLCRHRRFPVALFPSDPGIARGVLALRVFDALASQASQRDIARTLFGREAFEADTGRGSDSLRSRVRRLVAEAKAMAAGGYRGLMTRRDRPVTADRSPRA